MTKKMLNLMAVAFLLLALFGTSIPAQTLEDIKFPKLNDIKIPDVEIVTLDNGIRLYLLEDHSLPVFDVNVRIAGGSYLEPADKVGLADICGTVMRTGGTKKYTGDEIDAKLEGVGGAVETFFGLESGGAGINVLSEYTDMALEILAEVLRRPVFDEEKLNLAKVQSRSGISRRNDDPSGLTRREFQKQIYGEDSPYARHTEYATIDAISRDDLVAFHKNVVIPENIQMAISGDFDKKEIIAKVKQYFGDWEKGNVPLPPLPEVNYDFRSKVYYAEKPDAAQSFVRIGHIGGLVSDEDYAAKIVMNSILGGGFGSRLVDNVRTKLGLAYSTGGRYISNISHPGYFFTIVSTQPGRTLEAAREMMKQIESMKTDPPTEKEMKKGKDGYLNSFVFNFDTRGEVVNRMMNYDYYGMPEDFLQQEKAAVEKVTPEDVMNAAKNNLRTDEMIYVVVGNEADFDEPLSALGLGEAEVLDISIPSGETRRELEITDANLEKGLGLVRAAVAAHGGLDNFKAIKNLHTAGSHTIIMQGQEIPLQFETTKVLPTQDHSVMNLMGREMIDIRNNDIGWATDPMTDQLKEKTADDLANDDKENRRANLFIMQTSDAPDYRAVYDGSGDLDGVAIEYVALIDAAGDPICRLGFDAGTHELLCKEYWGQTALGEGNIQERYSEFAEVGGVKMAMKSESMMNDQVVTRTAYTTFEVNVDVPAGTFDKPE